MSTAPMRRDQASARRAAPQRGTLLAPSRTSSDLRLVVKRPGGVTLLRLDDIDCLEADGNVVVVHTAGNERHRIRETLTALLGRLTDHGFIRIHRGTAIRAAAIVAIEKGRYRKAFAVLRAGTRLEIGRAEFRTLKALWHPGLLDLRNLPGALHLVSTDV